MLQMSPIGLWFLALSLVPLMFLFYTVTHLDKLGIGFKHPRVLVEFSIFIVLIVVGLILWFS
jgi:hypothetical protein